MVTLRTVETDEDLELWRGVRLAVLPNERTATVAEIRAVDRPGRLFLLAEVDGVLAGHGIADRSDVAGQRRHAAAQRASRLHHGQVSLTFQTTLPLSA